MKTRLLAIGLIGVFACMVTFAGSPALSTEPAKGKPAAVSEKTKSGTGVPSSAVAAPGKTKSGTGAASSAVAGKTEGKGMSKEEWEKSKKFKEDLEKALSEDRKDPNWASKGHEEHRHHHCWRCRHFCEERFGPHHHQVERCIRHHCAWYCD